MNLPFPSIIKIPIFNQVAMTYVATLINHPVLLPERKDLMQNENSNRTNKYSNAHTNKYS